MSRQNDEKLLRDYLLGTLDEEKQRRVEERLLIDDGFAERLSVAEGNLIDDYVFAALSAAERESFEENFILNDERRKKLRLAQALEVYVDRLPAPVAAPDLSVPWWRNPTELLRSYKTWLVVTAIVILAFVAPKIIRKLKDSDIDRIGEQRAYIESRLAEFNRHPNDQVVQAANSYELVLEPMLLREGSRLSRATLSGDVKLLILKLTVPQSQHEKYRAVVSTAEGTELFGVPDLTREAGVVFLKIPIEFLDTGDYQIQLTGTDGIAEDPVRYYFRVNK